MVFHILIPFKNPLFIRPQMGYQHIHSPYYGYDGLFYIFIYTPPA